ncbi:hypothetical protein [Saccharospirillum mangrovi]|uniref:hypothetical protein n=1 Tax=Saccharospirillum mangrovi TaxID=2161747 RepID=UPI000D3C6A08|nr:hypothetical protein [Saccharospirillum mangrovi]
MDKRTLFLNLVVLGVALFSLAGCGGGFGPEAGEEPVPEFVVNGNVVGLQNNGLVLRNNRGETRSVLGGTTQFQFGALYAVGEAYEIRVDEQPQQQWCKVQPERGTFSSAGNVSVAVQCVNTYVTGNISGPYEGGLVMRDERGATKTVSAHFSLNSAYAVGDAYNITIAQQPDEQWCKVANGQGIFTGEQSVFVRVECVNSYVYGYVTGLLSPGLTLGNEQGTEVEVHESFRLITQYVEFPDTYLPDKPYAISIVQQPAAQTCSIKNGSGVFKGAADMRFQIDCTKPTGILYGVITGWNHDSSLSDYGKLELQNNRGETLVVTSPSDVQFAFNGPESDYAPGDEYSLTVTGHPNRTRCDVINGSGQIQDITDNPVEVRCAATQPEITLQGSIFGLEADGLMLLNNAGQTLPLTSDKKVFDFDALYYPSDEYAITITRQPEGQLCDLVNGAGLAGSPEAESIAIHCWKWQAAVNMGFGSWPQVALNDNGHAVVAWHDGTNLKARYLNNNAWGGVVTVAGQRVIDAPRVGLDGDGAGLLVGWNRNVDGRNILRSNVVSSTGAWSEAATVQESAINPALAMNEAGQALAVWPLGAKYYSGNNSWSGDPDAIAPSGAIGIPRNNTVVDINAAGTAIAVWQEDINSQKATVIRANIFRTNLDAEPSWDSAAIELARHPYGTETEVDGIEGQPKFVGHPHVAVNNAGQAVAVWEAVQLNEGNVGTGTVNILVSVYAQRDGVWEWSEPEQISDNQPGQGAAALPQVALDDQGRAVAIWQQQNETGHRDIWSSQYAIATSQWTTPEKRGAGSSFVDAINPQIAMREKGDAMVIWIAIEETEARSLVAQLYSPDAGDWLEQPRVLADVTSTAGNSGNNHHLVMNNRGQAMVVVKAEAGASKSVQAIPFW